ncbi:MAG TPA: hypothetical protein DCP92_02560 [Nitrospiraceae bacterium]|nr:hypothetical protein [Nitrospiraceae bacterium]
MRGDWHTWRPAKGKAMAQTEVIAAFVSQRGASGAMYNFRLSDLDVSCADNDETHAWLQRGRLRVYNRK